jgi:hypothetical protein
MSLGWLIQFSLDTKQKMRYDMGWWGGVANKTKNEVGHCGMSQTLMIMCTYLTTNAEFLQLQTVLLLSLWTL